MAGCIFTACTTAEGLLYPSSQKTMLKLISTTNQAIKIKEWGVFFDGVSVTAEPVSVALMDYTTAEDAGGWLNSAATPIQRAGKAITASRAIVQVFRSTSSHGWGGSYATLEVHPQSGYQEKFSYGDEIQICNGQAIGINVLSASSVNCKAMIIYEE